jgi:hypothetical protein
MAQTRNLRLKLGLFIIAVLAVGLPVWFNANHNHSNDATLTLAIPFMLALVYKMATKLSLRFICVAIITGALAAFVIKMFIDWHFDPTSHNLFPFEIIINGMLISFAVLIGISIGGIIQWLRARRNKSMVP